MSFDAEFQEGDYLKKFLDRDDKLKTWILVDSPYPVLTILLAYLLIVLKLGPYVMKSRPPIELHNTMRLYNLFQVLSNLFIMLELLVDPAAMVALVRTQCSIEELNKVEYNHLKDKMMWYGWAYLILKITDLLDTTRSHCYAKNLYGSKLEPVCKIQTNLENNYEFSILYNYVFMVLRKKNSHITFLHVYHHTAMVFFVWVCFRHSKSHHGVIPVFINLSVHVVMYSYYLLATFPALKERLWWKKHLTKFQLGQFVVVLLYFSYLYYNECHIPRIFTYVWMFNVSVFSVLFTNFYVKAYLKGSGSRKSKISS